MSINGIGTDIIANKRISDSDIDNRFLSSIEKELYKRIGTTKKNNFLSGRWTAKEAIIKASNKKYVFSDISIINTLSGKPIVLINGVEKRNIHISISHDIEYTIAFCLIEKV